MQPGNFVEFERDGKKGRIIEAMKEGYFVVYLPERATIVVHERELTKLEKKTDA